MMEVAARDQTDIYTTHTMWKLPCIVGNLHCWPKAAAKVLGDLAAALTSEGAGTHKFRAQSNACRRMWLHRGLKMAAWLATAPCTGTPINSQVAVAMRHACMSKRCLLDIGARMEGAQARAPAHARRGQAPGSSVLLHCWGHLLTLLHCCWPEPHTCMSIKSTCRSPMNSPCPGHSGATR